MYLDGKSTVTAIELDPESMMFNQFNPSYLLHNMGNPDQVLTSPSSFVMFYEKHNIFAEYLVTVNKGTQQACFSAFNSLYLWAPETKLSLNEIKEKVGNMNLKPWSEISKFDIQVFYDAFTTWDGTKNCFPSQ